jgi:hypothetical protein
MSERRNKEREPEESSSNTSTKDQTKLDETHRNSAQFLVQNPHDSLSLTFNSAPHSFLCLPCSFPPLRLRLQKASQATKPTTTEIHAECDDVAGI